MFASDDEAEMLEKIGNYLIDHGVLIQAQSEIHIGGIRRRSLARRGDFLLMIL